MRNWGKPFLKNGVPFFFRFISKRQELTPRRLPTNRKSWEGRGRGGGRTFLQKGFPAPPNIHNQLILLDEVFAVAADTEAVQLDEAGGVLVVIGGAFLKGGEVGAVQGVLGFAADGPRVALVELQAHGA